ncbi:MAG: hypothetical protein ABJK37_24510 [Paraglaciecola sp.]|uniref:hypothetical protein n=1 Tax=Paraglaciecola sp. TaxID=1920173 RepID=UPI0032991353
MNTIQTLELNALEHLIRNGLQPDNPPLIDNYIGKAECETDMLTTVTAKRQVLKRVFQTLMDTICDTYVASHWRRLCLDNVHRPLHAIEQLSISSKDKAEVLKLRYELNTLSRYFL